MSSIRAEHSRSSAHAPNGSRHRSSPSLFAIARAELRLLRAHAGLYLVVPLVVLVTVQNALSLRGALDTKLLPTPGILASSALESLNVDAGKNPREASSAYPRSRPVYANCASRTIRRRRARARSPRRRDRSRPRRQPPAGRSVPAPKWRATIRSRVRMRAHQRSRRNQLSRDSRRSSSRFRSAPQR